ncbi:hypothetical protein D3C76_641100 [compost metagenome]
MLGFAAAFGIPVVAAASLLAKALALAQGVVDLRQRTVHALPGQLPRAPLQIDADHVVHAKRPHGKTESLQRRVHLLRQSPLKEHLARLVGVGFEHAVADKATAVARHHCDLAQALPELPGLRQHRR